MVDSYTEYSNAFFEIYTPHVLNKFGFMFRVKNSWTEAELYTAIKTFILTTNFSKYVNVDTFTLYYNTRTRLYATGESTLQSFRKYAFGYPQFSIRSTTN